VHGMDERRKVSAQELVDINGQFAEIFRRIGEGSLSASDVSEALEKVIETLTALPDSTLALDRFTPPVDQVENFRKWSQLFNTVWTSDDIDRLTTDIPDFDNSEPLIPMTLCWTLSSLASSIDAKIEVMKHVYGADKVHVTSKLNSDAKHTSVISGGPPFEPNRLWWQLIDLGANRFKAPNEIPAATAAGCEVFDVICQHPIYVSQQDGWETPFLDLPGLSVKVRGFTGPDTPDATGGPSGKVAVHVNWEGSVFPDHAEPVREV
jgi:hypothetical protein